MTIDEFISVTEQVVARNLPDWQGRGLLGDAARNARGLILAIGPIGRNGMGRLSLSNVCRCRWPPARRLTGMVWML